MFVARASPLLAATTKNTPPSQKDQKTIPTPAVRGGSTSPTSVHGFDTFWGGHNFEIMDETMMDMKEEDLDAAANLFCAEQLEESFCPPPSSGGFLSCLHDTDAAHQERTMDNVLQNYLSYDRSLCHYNFSQERVELSSSDGQKKVPNTAISPAPCSESILQQYGCEGTTTSTGIKKEHGSTMIYGDDDIITPLSLSRANSGSADDFMIKTGPLSPLFGDFLFSGGLRGIDRLRDSMDKVAHSQESNSSDYLLTKECLDGIVSPVSDDEALFLVTKETDKTTSSMKDSGGTIQEKNITTPVDPASEYDQKSTDEAPPFSYKGVSLSTSQRCKPVGPKTGKKTTKRSLVKANEKYESGSNHDAVCKKGSSPKRKAKKLSSNKKSKKSTSSDTKTKKAREGPPRFRRYQAESWSLRFKEVKNFVRTHGHALIPHNYPPNQGLARWAKRQRYQYKLYKMGSCNSAMTAERVRLLDNLGFCWDAHKSLWNERFQELKEYKKSNGNVNVPSTYPPLPKLATWVKCQRRQYKLLKLGERANINEERVKLLESIGFQWSVSPGPGASKSRS